MNVPSVLHLIQLRKEVARLPQLSLELLGDECNIECF